MPTTYHKLIGEWGKEHRWEGARSRVYQMQDQGIVTENWLISQPEESKNFALRFYEVQPGCSTRQESHSHDHGVVVLQGQADAEIAGIHYNIQQGDVLYIAPRDQHVLRNTGDTIFSFLCIIPGRKIKDGQAYWAEGGLIEETNLV